MKLKGAIDRLGVDQSILRAKEIASACNLNWDNGASHVFSAIASDPDRVPGNIGAKKDDADAVILKWLLRYQKGYEGRASKRKSNPPGTIADPILEKVIGTRLTALSEDELRKITFAHRLGMAAENTLGLILEEYLAINIVDHGWHCAWGETVKSVDFVHENGSLLQIKNRSNSENSSSSSVRDGTEIHKWFRIKADRIEYMWDKLNALCGTTHLSENSFVEFVQKTIASNPDCLAIEPDNTWC